MTLAQALTERGARIVFICRELPGNLCDAIGDAGYEVVRLSPPNAIPESISDADGHYAAWLGVDWRADAEETESVLARQDRVDWLIVDHYALDRHWEKPMRSRVAGIMAIDDLADRQHDCDLLLDQNLCDNFEGRYDDLVPSRCRKMLGPAYALLRPEFRKARVLSKPRSWPIRRILVSFGGSDATNETLKTVNAIIMCRLAGLQADIVIGASYAHRNELETLCAGTPNMTLHYQTSTMAQLMLQADFAIGASGSTVWERMALDLPSLVINTAKNQEAIALYLSRSRYIYYLGKSSHITSADIAAGITQFMQQPGQLVSGREVVDGLGADRISDILTGSTAS